MFDFLVMNQRSDISQSGSEATAHIDQSESEGVHTVQLIGQSGSEAVAYKPIRV